MNKSTSIITPRVGVPMHALRRLAARALKVIERHGGKHGAIQAYQATFVPTATAYVDAWDEVQNARPARKKEVAEADSATLALKKVVQAWAAHLERDLPGIELEVFKRSSPAADDLIEASGRLLETVAAQRDGEGEGLIYADNLVADVEEARAAAIKERGEAQDLLAKLQERSAELRTLGAQVQAGLVALRRTLRAVLGSGHRDYQKLRQITARVVDEEDAEVVEGQAKVGDVVEVPAGSVPAGVDEEELEEGVAEVG